MQREIAAEYKEPWRSELELKIREALREIRFGTVTCSRCVRCRQEQ